jgi:DNA primase
MSTDEDIFASAMSETPTEPTVEQTVNTPAEATEAPTEAAPVVARDDKGRFAPKAPEAPEPVVQETATQPTVETPAPEGKPDVHVPSWRLAEEAQRRREAEQQLAEMRAEMRQIQQMQLAQQRQQTPQPQQEPIDPFADPHGFAQSIQQTFEQQLRERDLRDSLRFARHAHQEVFDKAYEDFVEHTHKTRDQATYQRVMQSSDPGEALVSWYKDQQLHRELGGSDLNSFLAKQREEWLKDPAVQAQVIEAFKATQQQTQPSNITNLPPSLSRATSAAPSHNENSEWSQESIFKHAMKR